MRIVLDDVLRIEEFGGTGKSISRALVATETTPVCTIFKATCRVLWLMGSLSPPNQNS